MGHVEDWYEFLDPDFSLSKEVLRTRDKVVTICSRCKGRSIKMIASLKAQIKKKGTHLCWSCSSSISAKKSRDKYLKTMREKYGVENPQQIPEIKEKTKKTNEARYGRGGSISKARKVALSKKKRLNSRF